MKFDHIGVLAPTLSHGRDHLTQLFGIERWTDEIRDPINDVWVQFGERGSICYEIVSPLSEQSPIATALKEKTRILNHVAYLVESLEEQAMRLKALRCAPVSRPKQAVAYGGALIQFFVSPLGFIFELIEAIDHRHIYNAKHHQ